MLKYLVQLKNTVKTKYSKKFQQTTGMLNLVNNF